ncbi:hypothetical protein ACFONG_02100 [Uliginosibacterium paludis]|uniref:Uncharacterized protein n=1 Tax=Uliginosibacterium paludis TaxID=1615952 RepID=A0ABV2CT39_9RHOO
MSASAYSVFEYIYRDAGNFKAWGELLLEGRLTTEEVARLTARLEQGELFIAEQIGVPTLYQELWRQCQCEPSDELDQVWHEFSELRVATQEDRARLKLWGSAVRLLAQLEQLGAWDVTRSQIANA